MTIKREYITVDGEVREYAYHNKPRSQSKRRLKCPTCGSSMRYLRYNYIQPNINAGHICVHCNYIFIYNNYKPFRLKECLLK